MSKAMRAATAVMTVVFLVWVYYQRNDPDPALWMAIYGAAALISFLALLGRLPGLAGRVAGILCIAGAGWIGGALATSGEFEAAFGAFLQDRGEPAREMLGLLITGLWLVFLGLHLERRGRTKGDWLRQTRLT